ncbi:GWxTD domain-containing protein [Hymenobacter psychrophilus]|uniref:GWxTD domain-containing protein n=1 Tax=Hymenobacter psychrophilus TaxID=651662 RepID=A0A1H3M832_9BACT|nr:GWxTD domain-containing protein [Hymenobacter psychrophilus]SDY72872.1 GWxTD domain-containing protein [Hymenobacter psychrophilus]
MKNLTSLLLLLLTLLIAGPLQAAPRRDFASQYRPGLTIEVDTRREGDSLRVYLRFPNRNALRRGFPLHVMGWADFNARKPSWQDTVRRTTRQQLPSGDAALLNFALPLSRLAGTQALSMAIGPAEDALSGDAAWLRLTPENLNRSFVLLDSMSQPLMRRYVRAREVFGVAAYAPGQTLNVYRYPLSSLAAAPPMASTNILGQQPRTLGLQDSARFNADQLLRLPVGLYLLRLGNRGPQLGLLVEENQFPKLTSADELIAPLIYVSTSQERQKLFDAPDPKKAVDYFWLGVANDDQDQARQLIRMFYGRVITANQFFTAHKAGWLTDRGMLYVVLGPPETVYRNGNEERWVYRGGQSQVGTFIFRAKPSTFAADNYELVRRPEHEYLWYAAVEQWRKGRTAQPGR